MTISDLYKILDENQQEYINSKSKEYIKLKSQYFTPISIANMMINAIDIEKIKDKNKIKILEPSAGGGILIYEVVFFILKNTDISEIYLDAYELDYDLYLILKKNINLLKEYVNQEYNIKMVINLFNDNFILSKGYLWKKNISHNEYDLIVSNPPYKKINRSSEESLVLKDISYGQPNLYSLFMGLSVKLLKENGIYVVLSPRSYLSGMYNEKLRKYIFNESRLIHIHSFYNRGFFQNANQEVIISAFVKDKEISGIDIFYNNDFKCNIQFKDLLYDSNKNSLIVPRCYEDVELYKLMNRLTTMDNIGIGISVGPVVQFREKLVTKELYNDNLVPLIVAKDIFNNSIFYYERENIRKTHNKAISIESTNLVKNSNYVLLQKVMAKDDNNSIVIAVLEKQYFRYKYLGIDNNILYFHKKDKKNLMTKDECYGLFCYINSYIFQQYYLLINSTHTINVSDFENIRFPSMDILKKMGKCIKKRKDKSKKACTEILLQYCENIFK